MGFRSEIGWRGRAVRITWNLWPRRALTGWQGFGRSGVPAALQQTSTCARDPLNDRAEHHNSSR